MPSERVDRVLSERNFDLVERLTAWAEGQGHTILELAFAWLAAQPTMGPVIAGAPNPAQVVQNVGRAGAGQRRRGGVGARRRRRGRGGRHPGRGVTTPGDPPALGRRGRRLDLDAAVAAG